MEIIFYRKFRQWCDDKVFDKILNSLVDSCRNFYLAIGMPPMQEKFWKIKTLVYHAMEKHKNSPAL